MLSASEILSASLLFFQNDNLKYAAIPQRRSFNSFSLLYILFFFHAFIFCYLVQKVYNLYCISYILRFCYVMYYIVSEIYIGRRFLEDCFYCYFQQLVLAVVKESLQKYRTKEPLILQHRMPPQTKSNKWKIRLSFLNKTFCSTQIQIIKNTSIIVCKMVCNSVYQMAQ